MLDDFLRTITESGAIIDVPRRIKGYDVIEVIGVGAFGVIVSLKDASKSLAAAKVMIRPEPNTLALKFMERELRLGMTISCPYLVRCTDVVYLDKVICMLMEHVEGETLFRLISDNKPLVIRHWKRIFGQMCLGIQYLHRRGLAHRDLKLDNVIVDHDLNVKLCDYGILCESQKNFISTTMCGTLPYMAPEIIRGNGYCAKQADMWALGISLYGMMTGVFPWVGSEPMTLFKEILESVIDIDVLPFDTQEIVVRCCDPSAERRATIDDVMAMPVLEMSTKPVVMSGLLLSMSFRKKDASDPRARLTKICLPRRVRRTSRPVNIILPKCTMKQSVLND